MPPSLPELLDRAEFVSLTLCRAGGEWQASLEVARGSFRVRVGSGPAEALAEVLGGGAETLPPLPY